MKTEDIVAASGADFITRPKSRVKDEPKNFTDHLVDLKGRLVEVFIGESYQSLNYDDYSVVENSSTFGRLVDVFDRFIVLECLYVNDAGIVCYGNKIYINGFQIRAMTLLNKEGGLKDIFLSNRQASAIRKILTSDGELPDTNKY